jgi:hypothetical protein
VRDYRSGVYRPGGEQNLSPDQEKQIVDNLRQWIDYNKPGIMEIELRLDASGPDLLLRSPAN